ncbi:CRISPR-associated protein (Cas_GSU0053) [Rubripirellula lacrimiformis]|uniref:CRISPR-associated protein (Cas_GSU0053) n=1 Tax=Rubripirellula lacrimiformis TaxID=1930273 RepID=A0A517NFL8_9BACT|nr:type I-U CRISPR-associated RAMP protein Csb1/Cas7u [Rubripirellula lacrimiformis]QDT05858.1 CRISPR-associated protein (Cas_GSU0053) [Rubripirellula lacrimiformis]
MPDLSALAQENRVLFNVALQPIQGDRFQPTGFPNLGAATYQTSVGQKLLVESAQSMANRLETVCWDAASQKPIDALDGISHVTVNRKGQFMTDTMLEAHRLNSPYLLAGTDTSFINKLKADLGGLAEGPIDRRKLAEIVFKYDVGSLIHGLFLAKSELAGGRLRIARAVSAFVEANEVRVAASGGVKNDHVNPSGETKSGFGNVPFARDEYTASEITCFINLDLAQIRGYGLGDDATELIVLLTLHRVRRLLDSDLRLRTACDLEPIERDNITAKRPKDFILPSLADLEASLPGAIKKCKDKMVHETVEFNDELKKAKEKKETTDDNADSQSEA